MNVSVSRPDVALEAAFLHMLEDYEAHDPSNGHHYTAARADFPAYVQNLHDDERGLVGVVSCSHRWLVSGEGALVGVVRVRHALPTRFLADEVGHIGYDVPPAWRGRGLGAVALHAGLEHARALGLEHVILYADTDNPASWRTIERCAGVMESEHYSPHSKCFVRRYRITIKAT
jgi:predicted acetyltransferase